MPRATHIQQVGNSLLIYYEDGLTEYAVPTMGSIWLVSLPGGPTPGTPGLTWPFTLSVVTSEFRPADRPNHDGMDFSGGQASLGSPTPSAGNGTVWKTFAVGEYGGYGNGVIIDHGTINGNNFKTLYGHMDTYPIVIEGATVTKGQNLGPVGNSGASFGAHCHFELWLDGTGSAVNKVNPRTYISDGG